MSARLDRAAFLRGLGAGAGALALGPLAAACSSRAASSSVPVSTSPKPQAPVLQPNWTLESWPNYIDTDAHGGHPTITAFDAQYSVATTYLDTISSNQDFFDSVQAQLAKGQSIGADVVVLSDWMASRWIQLGYVEPLDRSLLPGVTKRLLPPWQGRPIDPAGQYLVPYQSGLVGIAYDSAVIGPEDTTNDMTVFQDLLDYARNNPGKVVLVDDMRDTLGTTMLGMPHQRNPTSAGLTEISEAVDYLRGPVQDGAIRFETDYVPLFESGEVSAGLVWSPDVPALLKARSTIHFNLPPQGVMFWSDNMLIPKGAAAPRNAHAWMNWCYKPNVAATIERFLGYTCPVKGAGHALETGDVIGTPGKDDAALAADPLRFPLLPTQKLMRSFNLLELPIEEKAEQLFSTLTS